MTQAAISGTAMCRACGTIMHKTARACPRCGADPQAFTRSDKTILAAGLLCFIAGVLGAHRFYVGKFGTALLQLLTLGGLGVWAFIDLLRIIAGVFKDKRGKRLRRWT